MTSEPAEKVEALAALRKQMTQLQDRRYADNTRQSYRWSWDGFTAWCTDHGLRPLPADSETLALYATWLASRDASPNSISARISAIRAVHRYPQVVGLRKPAEPYPVPDAHAADLVIKSHRRARKKRGWNERQMNALRKQHLLQMREEILGRKVVRPIDVRDWAMLLLGFALMARRSELSCLDITDIRLDPPHWLLVRICSSKTDQDAVGAIVQIRRGQDHTLCAVAAVLDWIAWLRMKGIDEGPLFRSLQGLGTKLTVHGRAKDGDALSGRLSGQAINMRIKARARRADVDLPEVGGHSVRRGGATSAREAGASAEEIADHGRWTRNSRALQRYIDQADQREHNPMARVL